MSGNFLLDTNIVIEAFHGRIVVQKHLPTGRYWFVSSIALGELHYGALRSRRVAVGLAQVEALDTGFLVLACDAGTARAYAQIRNLLRSKGKPLPENDIWIAATALQHELTLVTRDQHFQEVEGLAIEAW